MGNIEKKMVDFWNHRRLWLRCFSNDVIAVNVKFKSTTRIPRGCHIIKKVGRHLLNEHVKSINNTLELYMYQKEACMCQLREVLDHISMKECQILISSVVEARHNEVLEGQRETFDKLCQCKTDGHSNLNTKLKIQLNKQQGGGHSNFTIDTRVTS